MFPEPQYFIGIDGGGSGCRARITDVDGTVLGEGASGPANVAQSLRCAVDSILEAARLAAADARFSATGWARTRAGLGLAGANSASALAAFAKVSLPFLAVHVVSDAEIACIGAHRGDGAIVIVGTGSHALMLSNGVARSIGGWGFSLGDQGSGANLGHAAARIAIQSSSGLSPASPLTEAILAQHDGNPQQMMEWSLSASPRDWGTLAPLVIQFASQGDPIARALLAAAVAETEQLIKRLIELGARRICLMGGLANIYRPLLSSSLARWITDPKGDALDGALYVAGLRRPEISK